MKHCGDRGIPIVSAVKRIPAFDLAGANALSRPDSSFNVHDDHARSYTGPTQKAEECNVDG